MDEYGATAIICLSDITRCYVREPEVCRPGFCLLMYASLLFKHTRLKVQIRSAGSVGVRSKFYFYDHSRVFKMT